MPSNYTHNYFAKEVYKNLDLNNIKPISNKRYYQIFAQSFDNLFYYNFLSIKKGAKYRDLGYYAQVHKVWNYFKNMVIYMKSNSYYTDESLGYLYGSLTHYAMDSTCHPYIHYIAGRFSYKDKKKTRKYIGNHAFVEIMIDAIYYNNSHDDGFYKYKIYKDMIPKTKFSGKLKDLISYTFKETFNENNIGEIYNKSYNQSHDIYKLLMYDRFGIKKVCYKVFDFLVPFKNFKAYTYSHHIKKIDPTILNLKHETWLHPVTGEKHKESFFDLYNEAMKKSLNMIYKCNDYFNNKISLQELEKEIGNISYSSGLDLGTKPDFRYFKY